MVPGWVGFIVVPLVVIVPTVIVIMSMRRRARATRSAGIEAEYARAGFEVIELRTNGGPVVKGTHQGVPFVLPR
jgi:hypothetical protein